MIPLMADISALNAAFRGDPKARPTKAGPGKASRREAVVARRELRAMRTRAQALSPLRIMSQVLLVPVVTLALSVSIYTRISPYERTDALRHLAALAGCDTAASMGLAPAFEGGLGYHARNDPDGDGVACAAQDRAARPAATSGLAPEVPKYVRGGAKFLRP